MASQIEFVEYICQQLRAAGEISYKKMFGDYGFYLDGKFFGLTSDDEFFVKKTAVGSSMLENPIEKSPYEGAKPCFLVDFIDNHELLCAFVKQSCEELPFQKPKKKKVNTKQ